MDKVFKRTKNISLFCSVYLAFSSFFLSLSLSLPFSHSFTHSCTLASVWLACVCPYPLVVLPFNAFLLGMWLPLKRHQLSLILQTFISCPLCVSVTFYLKIYDCCSFFCMRACYFFPSHSHCCCHLLHGVFGVRARLIGLRFFILQHTKTHTEFK